MFLSLNCNMTTINNKTGMIMNNSFCTAYDASNKINQAMSLAIWAHHGLLRKDGSPFLLHPIAVSRELIDAGIVDPDIQAAALLHDMLEERHDIREECLRRMRHTLGELVAEWVVMLTDDMRLSSADRKAAQIFRYRDAPVAVRMIKLADRCANLASPPPTWDSDKIKSYSEHSFQLLQTLRGTHTLMERRLIETLTQDPWRINSPCFRF